MRSNPVRVMLGDLELVVDADYQKPEPMTWDSPAIDEGFDIGGIWCADGVTVFDASDDDIEAIERELFRMKRESDGADAFHESWDQTRRF